MKLCFKLIVVLLIAVLSNTQTTTYMNPSYDNLSKQTSLPPKNPPNPPNSKKTVTSTLKPVIITTTRINSNSISTIDLPDNVKYCKNEHTCDSIYYTDKYGDWSIENVDWCYCGQKTVTIITKTVPLYTPDHRTGSTTNTKSAKNISTSSTKTVITKTVPVYTPDHRTGSTSSNKSIKTIPTSTTNSKSVKTIPTSTTTYTIPISTSTTDLLDNLKYCKNEHTCDSVYYTDKYGDWSIENADWCYCGQKTVTIITKTVPIYTPDHRTGSTSNTKSLKTVPTSTTSSKSVKTVPTSTTSSKSVKTIPTSTTSSKSVKTIPTSTTSSKSVKTIPTSTTSSSKSVKTIPTSSTTQTIPPNPTSGTKCLPMTVTVTKKVTITEKVTVTIYSSEPTNQSQNCAKKWEQCGGTGYSGPNCCEQGTTCYEYNSFYSQCL